MIYLKWLLLGFCVVYALWPLFSRRADDAQEKGRVR